LRVLIAGGGCRARVLTRELVADGHAVRQVTRDETARAQIEAAGAECWIGTPDRIGSLRYALENVTVLLWALGTATGSPEDVEALHGSRLQMMLEKTIDTTVRGFVYEARGTVPAEHLAAGRDRAASMASRNEIPFAILEADPADEAAWVAGAHAALESVLKPVNGDRNFQGGTRG